MDNGPSKKQQQVLGLIAEGQKPKDIAKRMKISVNGVYGHMRKLKAKGLLTEDGQITDSLDGVAAKATAKAKVKAATNGGTHGGTVDQVRSIVEGTIKTIENRQGEASTRQKEISVEIARLREEDDALAHEQDTLDKQKAALGAV